MDPSAFDFALTVETRSGTQTGEVQIDLRVRPHTPLRVYLVAERNEAFVPRLVPGTNDDQLLPADRPVSISVPWTPGRGGDERLWVVLSAEALGGAEEPARRVAAHRRAAPWSVSFAQSVIAHARASAEMMRARGFSIARADPSTLELTGEVVNEDGSSSPLVLGSLDDEGIALMPLELSVMRHQSPARSSTVQTPETSPSPEDAPSGCRLPVSVLATPHNTARALRERFPARTGVLFLHASEQDGGEATEAFLVTAAGLVATGLGSPTNEPLETRVARMRRAFSSPGQVVSSDVGATDASRGLTVGPRASVATAPVGPLVHADDVARIIPHGVHAGLRELQHVIVVPFGGIGSLPLSALPLDDGSVWIDHSTISVLPTIADLWSRGAAWSGPGERALVVGNPAFADPALTLAGAEREAQAVAMLLGSDPVLGCEATRARVLRDLATTDIAYFATHSTHDPSDPLDNRILLAGEVEDGLSLREILELDLHQSLVVLSSCESGIGLDHTGGVISLGRAFQKAGVPRVIMSQWQVADDATVELMTMMVRFLRDHPPATALRLAQLEARRRRPHPFYWAPFVYFGSPR